MSPISRKEFEKGNVNLKKEILAFLDANNEKAFTAEEIMSKVSFQTNLDLEAAPRVSVFIAANLAAFLNDLAAEGSIKRKVVSNRMYFMSVKEGSNQKSIKVTTAPNKS
jgi:hypothetical protein